MGVGHSPGTSNFPSLTRLFRCQPAATEKTFLRALEVLTGPLSLGRRSRAPPVAMCCVFCSGAGHATHRCRQPTRAQELVLPKERVERDEEDLVRLYLTDIGQYPLLTKDDEVRLAQQIEAGNSARGDLLTATKDLTAGKKRELRRTAREGDDAQRTFVQSNLRLVVSIAKKYQASGLPLLDLIQEGNLGLMHAVE